MINTNKEVLLLGDLYINSEESFFLVYNFIKKINVQYTIILNLECSIYSEKSPNKAIKLFIEENYLLRLMALDVYFIIVNNHSFDGGLIGFEKLKNILGEKCLVSTKSSPVVKINNWSIGLFGCKTEQVPINNVTDFWSFKFKDIKDLNFDIALVHGGLEYEPLIQPYFYYVCSKIYNKYIVFNHNHIIGDVYKLNSNIIINGLGNFCFDRINNLHGGYGYSKALLLKKDKNVLHVKVDLLNNDISSYDFNMIHFHCDFNSYRKHYIGNATRLAPFKPYNDSKSYSVNMIKYYTWELCYRITQFFKIKDYIKKCIK